MSNLNSEVSTSLTTTSTALTAAETLAQPENALDALSVEQLTMEAKFYFVQMGQNAVEFGKRLIAVKKKLQHGEWLNWLQDNFSLTDRSARYYMAIAERFGNLSISQNRKSISYLGVTKMISLLALPEGEEEKFIEDGIHN